MISICTFDFSNQQKKFHPILPIRSIVKNAVIETLKTEKFTLPAYVSVTFTDNKGIHELNRTYRNIDRATDVLSFPMYDFRSGEKPLEGERVELGDVVISLERAKEQSEEYGHSFEREVAFLTVHSILHLLGYDHEISEEEDNKMREHQRIVLDKLQLTR